MSVEKKNSLLIVDDDKSNLLVLIDILQQDYTIYTAKDGEDAIKKAGKYLPDLILLDILLPKMDGYEVFSILQESDETGKIPIIFITGLTKSDNEEKGLELGAIDYITKPFNSAIVKLKVMQQIKIINLQRALETAVEVAESASISKSQFLATMSHEIRTPMNAILGITEILLQNKTLEPNMEEALTTIYHSGDLLLNIINDILDLSKIEAGKLELLPLKYETASLINDAITLNIMRIGSKLIEFKLSLDENIPSFLIGDEPRIKQILNNLLSNAFKYTGEGQVMLSVFAEQKSDTEMMLVCSVSDTGQGMTEDQVNKLFNNEYIRFNMKANRKTEGTGLGLSITHKLVKLMHGEISVQSELNKGSVFTVSLPQKIAGSGILGKELAENLQKFELSGRQNRRKAQIIFEPMPYGNVLIVDDVESNLYVAKGLLAPYDLSIETVTNGAEAISKVRDGSLYDIIFMDHMMPGMDGIEAAQKIRDMGYTSPIVALTANAVVGQSDIFLKNGFDDFISKPIDTRQLNSVLKKLIRDKQPPEIIAAANRQKSEQKFVGGESVPLTPQLAEIFVRDAINIVTALEAIHERDIYDDEDMRIYTISAHAIKSALHNVGETESSGAALKLEDAGRAKDAATLKAETPEFLTRLRLIIKKLTPEETTANDDETLEENYGYLDEKLFAIQSACTLYDKKAAKNAINELREKAWPRPIKELLATMAEQLLNGDYEAILRTIDKIRSSNPNISIR